jgi:hypothetical protein
VSQKLKLMSQAFPAFFPLKLLTVGEGSAVRFRIKPWEIKTL